MSRTFRSLGLVMFGVLAVSASAQVLKWGAGGKSLVAQNNNQTFLAAAPTVTGKVAIAWLDTRTSPANVYFAFCDSVGSTPAAGFPVAQVKPAFEAPGITGDWADGCAIGWVQDRDSTHYAYVQHFTSAGAATWNGGQPVSLTVNNRDSLSNLMLFAGPNKSTFVIYTVTNTTTGGPGAEIYMQRFDQSGSPMWFVAGTSVATGPGDQVMVAAVPTASGGMILVWNDGRNFPAALYAQEVDSAGVTQWGNNGVKISGTNTPGGRPVAVPDGAGGAIIAYSAVVGPGDSNLVAQRLNSAGKLLWGNEGKSVCDTSGYQVSPAIVADGAAGAIIAWIDSRAVLPNVFAQHVNSSGVATWKRQGVPVCVAGTDADIHMGSDGLGGVVMCWTDGRGSPTQIYMQTVNSSGVPLWRVNGVSAGSTSSAQQRPVLVTQGLQGYAFLAWEDAGSGGAGGVDILGQRAGYQATIATSRNRLDFGTIRTHTPWSDTLRIRCTGTDSLRVNAWSFTGPSPDTDTVFVVTAPPSTPFSLGPGEDSVITITFTPYQNTANIDTLVIHCSALGTDSIRRVSLAGKGKYPHLQSALATVNFAGVRLRTVSQKTLFLRNIGTDTAHIFGHSLLGSNKNQFSDSLAVFKNIPPRDSIPLLLACSPVKLGSQLAQLQLIADDSTSPVTITLQANGIFPKTKLTRSGLTFGKVRVATSKSIVVGIVNAGTDTLHIDSIVLNDDPAHFAFQPAASAFPMAVKPLDTLKLSVTFSPDTLRTFRGTVQIFTDDTSEFYQVNAVGQGSFATLELQQAIEFGAVAPPQAPDSSIVVRYSGSDTVTIKSYTITGPDSARFTVSGIAFPFTVTAGETKIVHVRYTPDVVKRDYATLTFVAGYSGGTFDTLTVLLSGGSSTDVFERSALPDGLTLSSGYPNPIAPASDGGEYATFVLSAEHANPSVEIWLVNAAGGRVGAGSTLALAPGSRAVRVNVRSLPAGAYALVVRAGEGILSRRLVVVR